MQRLCEKISGVALTAVKNRDIWQCNGRRIFEQPYQRVSERPISSPRIILNILDIKAGAVLQRILKARRGRRQEGEGATRLQIVCKAYE